VSLARISGSLAEQTLSLLTSAELGVRQRSECVRVARDGFSYNQMVDLYENTYREVGYFEVTQSELSSSIRIDTFRGLIYLTAAISFDRTLQ
jgi:hypothetical protein